MNSATLEQHLCDLEATLADLLQLQKFKQLAASTLSAKDLGEFTSRENQLFDHIRELAQERALFLDSPGNDSSPIPSLRALIQDLPDDVRLRMKAKVRRIRGLAKRLRLQASASWIACRRAFGEVQQMLEFIAAAGSTTDFASSLGGVILDSTA